MNRSIFIACRKLFFLGLLSALVGIPQTGVADTSSADKTDHDPIDLSLFQDGISHWRKKWGRDRNDEYFDPSETVAIADHLLEFQNPDGGWPKDIDWLAKITRAEVAAFYGKPLDRSTFDNRNTYSQVEYLAKAYSRTGEDRFREGAAKGLDYILREQRPTGGWRGADVDAITFNDSVMTGILNLLLDMREGASPYVWLDEDRGKQVADALSKGIEAILACQIVVDGTKTAWCQQHDHATFLPVKARKYELPSICANESVDVVEFLQRLPDPDPRVTEAIQAALAWFHKSALHGIRLEKVPIEPHRFLNHTATTDTLIIQDPAAPPIWARFYDLETSQPLFCRGDGTRVATFEEVDLDRRTGYAWFGYWPARLVEDSGTVR